MTTLQNPPLRHIITQASQLPPSPAFPLGNSNKTLQLRGWASPSKSATLGALTRGAVAVVDSSNPLNATKAAAQGLALYKRETKALLLGQSGIVTFVNSVGSYVPAADIRCFVDPATGQLVGLQQAAVTKCSTSGDAVVIPISSGYISQIKLAYTYDGLFVGRLVFEMKANATAKPVSYTCGSAGGKAVDLLPDSNDYIVTKIGAQCAPLSKTVGLWAQSFIVSAAPLSSLPVDPATGVSQTPQLGGNIAPQGGGSPTPAPTSAPTPSPTTPPPAPIVTTSSATLSTTATSLVINGFNFDPAAAGNVVALSSGTVASISSASATSLTVVFATQPSAGALSASVTSFGLSSGPQVMVANVVGWNVVGTAGFSAGDASYTSLAIDPTTGTPYLGYQDGGNALKATVQKFVAGTGWTVVGTAGFSAGTARFTSLAIDSTGTPFLGYKDNANSNKATVQKFVAGTWTVVGTPGFSAGTALYTSLAIDPTGTPFLGYVDGVGTSNKATVQRYA